MLIVRPDPDRRIDLPGAGPCPRPVDIDRARAGFKDLVAFRVYSFGAGLAIDGEAEDDEVFVTLMRGEADIAVSRSGAEVTDVPLRPAGGMRVVYLPPGSSYRLRSIADCDIAYARATPRGHRCPEPLGFAPADDKLDIAGHAVGMELSFGTTRPGSAPGPEGRSPERVVHVRTNGAADVAIAGRRLEDWDTAALLTGESASLEVRSGTCDVLTISARNGSC